MKRQVGRFSHPIYSKDGGWPPMVEEYMAKLSQKEGFINSRLPTFTDEEKEFIKGTYDFYGMNHYTSRVVRRRRPDEEMEPGFFFGSPELDLVFETRSDWDTGAAAVLPIYPEGIRKQLAWLKRKYGDMDIIVTENGFSSADTHLNDQKRIRFIHDYLEQILFSITIDKVNVIGYSYWSLIDNFEWLDGYTIKYGLYQVDFNDPNRPRTPRDSAEYYASIIKTKTLIDPDVYLKNINQADSYKIKEILVQNGGCCVVQNGGYLVKAILIVLIVNKL